MATKLAMRVNKGALTPADKYAESSLREMKLAVGDIVFCQISKPRNPAFNRLVHAFARLVSENIEAFAGMDPHAVLKRIQIEGNIACQELGVHVKGMGMMLYRIPESLSFSSMDEVKFREVYTQFCRFISDRYWPDMEPEQIEQMAEVMAQE